MLWNSKNIVETIGIAALILSLVFVGFELRQNSAIARMEAHNQFLAAMSEGVRGQADNPELSSLIWDVTTNRKNLEDLTGGERMQIRQIYMGNLYTWYALFQSIQEGILDEKYLENIANGGLHNSDTFRALWPGIRQNYSDEFVEFFKTLEWNSANP